MYRLATNEIFRSRAILLRDYLRAKGVKFYLVSQCGRLVSGGDGCFFSQRRCSRSSRQQQWPWVHVAAAKSMVHRATLLGVKASLRTPGSSRCFFPGELRALPALFAATLASFHASLTVQAVHRTTGTFVATYVYAVNRTLMICVSPTPARMAAPVILLRLRFIHAAAQRAILAPPAQSTLTSVVLALMLAQLEWPLVPTRSEVTRAPAMVATEVTG